ncbi:MAG: hypothetical protein IPN86_13550 [Saprospiraceae bacterium]|nr:hypothetical protein [Saprospiraceae bacterium]
MINKKIIIFTSLTMKPAHPRILMEKEILSSYFHKVEIVSAPYLKNKVSFKFKVLNYLTLSFFRWDLIFLYRTQIKNFDIGIIYDLTLLPFALFIKNKDKSLIYETIDDNVHLTMYNLTKMFPLFKIFSIPIIYIFGNIEKNLIKYFFNGLIVNSRFLFNLLEGSNNKIINYYSSPFENITLPCNDKKEIALLYLGIFSEEKGALEILSLRKKLEIPLFIFGDVKLDKFEKSEFIFIYPRLNIDDLKIKIIEFAKEYKFLGLSLIEPINISYANQVANKDIDYLCLGIPIIGNYRNTTRELIEAECGVFIDEMDQISLLINDDKFYKKISLNCSIYYRSNFRQELFSNNLLNFIGKV